MKPIFLHRVIDARGLTDADIIRQVHMRTLEALRDRDRAEGRDPYPANDGRVAQVRIELDFMERVDSGEATFATGG